MKPVQLPDGQIIQFPDTMHDEQIDRGVRAILGVDVQQKEDALSAVLAQIQGIGQTLGDLVNVIHQAAQKDDSAENAAMRSQIQDLGAMMNQNNDALMQAVTAPREVTLPDNRKFTSVVKVPNEQH